MSVPVPPSKLIRKLSAYFGVLDIFERVPFRAGDPPRLSSIPWGSSYGSVRVATFNCQTVLPLPRARRPTVKPFEKCELHGHCHHLPGITNCQSARYAEIGSDRLRTRTASVVREFGLSLISSKGALLLTRHLLSTFAALPNIHPQQQKRNSQTIRSHNPCSQ